MADLAARVVAVEHRRPGRRVRKQYHFWPAGTGLDAWDVGRLIELSRGLPVQTVAVESIGEVDLSYPVILGPDGRVMDGMHRIALALLDGVAEVSAVRFPSLPEPDYHGIQPDQLPY